MVFAITNSYIPCLAVMYNGIHRTSLVIRSVFFIRLTSGPLLLLVFMYNHKDHVILYTNPAQALPLCPSVHGTMGNLEEYMYIN